MAVDERIRQTAQNRYPGNMTDTQRKWLAVGFGLVALLIVGSEFLLGQPLNSPRPANRLMASVSSVPISSFDIDNNIRTNSILISFKKEATVKDRDALAQSLGGRIVQYDPRSRIAVVQIPSRKTAVDMIQLAQQLGQNPLVEFASPDIPLQYYGVH